MKRIFIAATADDVAAMKRILEQKHETVVVTTMAQAVDKLKEQTFDLIMVGVHFDESRMFELLRDVHLIAKNAGTPIICFCTRDTPLTRTMHESIAVASKALGAWMYLDQHEFNVVKDPDGEMRRIIERCLTGEARKKTQASRVDSQQQREELHRLREAMESQDWSENLEERVVELRRNLSAVLLNLCESQIASLSQQEQVAESRDQKDRVSDTVQQAENVATQAERKQSRAETMQTAKEVQISEREEGKRTEGRSTAGEDKDKKA